ncbi:MAG: hypothetical protein H7Z42_10600 [Roseiflexaceae bacterium]|nr:hypothetical protein [Roseiflexaceae bacterium]
MTFLSTHNRSKPVSPRASSAARQVAYSALLTLALSLPQGLLALPIAVAQVGLVRGLLILLVIGALNIVTTAWTARSIAAYFTRHGVVPSLAKLAHDQLGAWGLPLTLGSAAALFFLALLASIVGLAHSFADLTGTPALIGAAGCGLIIILLSLGRAVLDARLLVGLGLLNIGLIVLLLLLMLPHVQAAAAPATLTSPLVMLGVSLMLFFAPMLVAPVAQQVLPHGGSPQAFVRGSAAGVAAGVVLFALWSVAVSCVVGTADLAASAGASIPLLVVAVPAARLPALLLGFLLLGMTALRCTLVLNTLAEEQLPARLQGRSRQLAAQLPAGFGLLVALALLLTGAASFTQLIAVTGGGAASLSSLLIPTLLRYARSAITRRSAEATQPVPASLAPEPCTPR